MDDETPETLKADENVVMSYISAATRAKARLGFLLVRIIFMLIRIGSWDFRKSTMSEDGRRSRASSVELRTRV